MKKISIICGALGMLLLACGVYFVYHLYYKPVDVILNYPYVGDVSNDMVVVSDGDKFGYYNLKWDTVQLSYSVIPQMKKDDEIDLSSFVFRDGVAPFTEKNKIGLMDVFNNIILKAQFDYLDVYNRDCIIVFYNHQYRLINDKNQNILADEFDSVTQIDNSALFVLSNDKGVFLYDADAKKYLVEQVLDIKYFKVSDGDNFIISITNDDNLIQNYYYQSKGSEFKKLNSVDGLYPYDVENNQAVFINDSGPVCIYYLSSDNITNINGNYVGFGTFNSGLSLVFNDSLLAGFVDKDEQLVIPYMYQDGTTNFNDKGIAIVSNGTNYGAINTTNEVVIPLQYLDISYVYDDIYAVTDSDFLTFLYDVSKHDKISDSYNVIDLSTIKFDLLVVQKDSGLYGLITRDGKEILKPKYKDIKLCDEYVTLKISKNKYNVMSINQIY